MFQRTVIIVNGGVNVNDHVNDGVNVNDHVNDGVNENETINETINGPVNDPVNDPIKGNAPVNDLVNDPVKLKDGVNDPIKTESGKLSKIQESVLESIANDGTLTYAQLSRDIQLKARFHNPKMDCDCRVEARI